MVFNSNNQGIAKEINACLLLFTLNKKWMVHSYKLLVNRKIYSFCTNQMTKVFMEKNLRNPKGHFYSHPIAYFLSNIFEVHWYQTSCGFNCASLFKWLLLQNCVKLNGMTFFYLKLILLISAGPQKYKHKIGHTYFNF